MTKFAQHAFESHWDSCRRDKLRKIIHGYKVTINTEDTE